MRSKDGVPQWNGDASQFQEYEDMCLQWEQSIAHHKRYLCAPRLIAELGGTARKFVIGKKPDWVSYNGGVAYFLGHLRRHLGRPQIPELSEHLNRYFRQSKRQKHETMNTYIVRKTETYARARQALARVQEAFDRRQDRHDQWGRGGWYQSWHWGTWSSRQSYEGGDESLGEPGQEASEPTEGQDQNTEGHDGGRESRDGRSGSEWGSSYTRSYHPEDEDWTLQTPELLPDFLQGWYLLADSGLTSQEKNMIQTAVAGDFSLLRIAQELRTQWPEDDLVQRDSNQKHSGFWHDDAFSDDDEPNHMSANALVNEGMNDEGLALVTQAVEEAEEALALIQQGKRTLKEARAKQHQVRMNRQYYKTKTYETKTADKKQGMACFRCGGPHRVRDCPDRQAPSGSSAQVTDEAAPFVCFTQGTSEAYQAMSCDEAPAPLMTTEQAVTAGYGIVDGGATRTIGSTYALEAIASENFKKRQDGGVLEVDCQNTPKFGFGNSSVDTCVSTAKMKIYADSKPGVLQVHALDRGQGPVLLSISTLRALKAVIDFESDLIVFRALDDKKAIQATRSQAGHQLLPLTDDLYRDAVACHQRVPSLREFVGSS